MSFLHKNGVLNISKGANISLDTSGFAGELSTADTTVQKALDTLDDMAVEVYTDRGDPSAQDWTLGDLTTDGSWHDLDLSSIVPAGASVVHLKIRAQDDAAVSQIGFREKGNSNDPNQGLVMIQVANIPNHQDIWVTCDSNRVIQYKATNTTWTDVGILVRGWFA